MSIRSILVCIPLWTIAAAGQATPKEVLVGTDLKPLSSYHFSKEASLASGRYVAETGGARIELTVRESDSAMQMVRVYREPGEKPRARVYSGLVRSADGTYRTKGIVVRVPDRGGVLVFERSSGLEEIPNSYWIDYGSQRGKVNGQGK